MRKVTLRIPVVALALCLTAARLAAQEPGSGAFQWYVGGQGGVLNFRTSAQDRTTIPTGGGNLLVIARRTGLLLSVEEAFGSDEVGIITDGVGTTHAVFFNNIRKYSAALMAFPVRIPIQPYFGAGVGIMHVVNPSTTGSAQAASELGSTGFGTFIGGVQFRLARFVGFGQYQITTSPSVGESSGFGAERSSGRVLEGPTHTFTAGLRIGLGNARERAGGGGY
jgi:opacity protein-like surface antigen